MQNISLLVQAVTERALLDYDTAVKRSNKCRDRAKYCLKSCKGRINKKDCYQVIREIKQYVQGPIFTTMYPNIDGLELLKKIEEGQPLYKYTKTK